MECKERNVITGITRSHAYLYHGPRETHAQQQGPLAPNRRFLFTVNVAFEPLCSPQNKSIVLLQALFLFYDFSYPIYDLANVSGVLFVVDVVFVKDALFVSDVLSV